VQVVAGDRGIGCLVAPGAHGDLAIGVQLVPHAAASAAARHRDLARRAREWPARSRSELLAQLLMPDSAVNEDLLDRAREPTIPAGGWHVAARIEADDLAESGRYKVHRFELLQSAGQVALQAATAAGGTWYVSRIARAPVRDQLAPLEKLGPARAETAIQTLAVFLDRQGSIIKTAQKLHLHRNAVADRQRGITEPLEVDLADPGQRFASQLASRARLLDQLAGQDASQSRPAQRSSWPC
jgi:hypothetical protein